MSCCARLSGCLSTTFNSICQSAGNGLRAAKQSVEGCVRETCDGAARSLSYCYGAIKCGASATVRGACKAGKALIYGLKVADEKTLKLRPSLIHVLDADSKTEKLLGAVQGVRGVLMLATGVEGVTQLAKGTNVGDIIEGDVEEEYNPTLPQLIRVSVILTSVLETAALFTVVYLRKHPEEIENNRWALKRAMNPEHGALMEVISQARGTRCLQGILRSNLSACFVTTLTSASMAGIAIKGGHQVVILAGAGTNIAIKALKHCAVSQTLRELAKSTYLPLRTMSPPVSEDRGSSPLVISYDGEDEKYFLPISPPAPSTASPIDDGSPEDRFRGCGRPQSALAGRTTPLRQIGFWYDELSPAPSIEEVDAGYESH